METVLQTGLSNAVVASALALIAVLVGYFYRRPALIHGLWLLVLVKLVTPPLVPIPIHWPLSPVPDSTGASQAAASSSDTPLSAAVVLETPPGDELPRFLVQADPEMEPPEPQVPSLTVSPAPPAPWPWQTLVAGVWLAGSAGWFLLAGWRVLRFRRLLRFAAPAPESLRKMAQRLAHRMKLRTAPALYLIPGRLAPMLWAVGGKPLLLVPRELLPQLTVAQQETLLAHELAHLHRRDHWVRGLEFLVMGLYWWHPVVWYACHALREVEEQCCDAWVVSLLPEASKSYATALLETLDFLADPRPSVPLLASGIGHVYDLKRRLTMIMCGTTPPALTWRGTLSVLALGLFVLPLLPTLANAQTEDKQQDLERQLAQARAELVQAQDAVRVKAELDKAHADLALLQAELNKKLAQIQELELRVAGKNAKADQQAAPPRAVLARALWANGNQEPIEIILRKVGDKWEIIQPKMLGKTAILLEEKDGVLRIVPANPAKPRQPDPNMKPVLPPRAAPEGRIEDLERQLKTILLELEMLRKELKQPGNYGTTPTPRLESR